MDGISSRQADNAIPRSMSTFRPSNSDDMMGLVEIHCLKCCHEEYARDPEADGARCPILSDIIMGKERAEVTECDDGSVKCSQWKARENGYEPIEVPDPDQLDLFQMA